MRSATYLVLYVSLLLCMKESSSATTRQLLNRCFINKKWYESGETFPHWFKNSPCKFECTCVIRKVSGRLVPTGSCTHSCPPFSYPSYGCHPVSDGCCAKSYVCPDGEKCKDKTTGMLYKVNETWTSGGCECICIGKGTGNHQCKCSTTETIEQPTTEGIGLENPCNPDDSVSCRACPIGMATCPIRAKCEKWTYKYQGIDLECTCYGPKGTRCISKKRDNKKTARRKRSSANQGISLFMSEGQKGIVEPIATEILSYDSY